MMSQVSCRTSPFGVMTTGMKALPVFGTITSQVHVNGRPVVDAGQVFDLQVRTALGRVVGWQRAVELVLRTQATVRFARRSRASCGGTPFAVLRPTFKVEGNAQRR